MAIVIPAYQEAATVGGVVARCRALGLGTILVVDDGSTDGTASVAEAAGAHVLLGSANGGKGAALARGLHAALADGAACIVTLDADGQHRPEDLPALMAAASAWPGCIVVGSRRATARDAPRGRRISNRVADFWVSWAAGWPVEDSQSGFRVYPAEVLRRLDWPRETGFAWESAVLIAAGRQDVRTVVVDIPTLYGTAARPSHFRPVLDIARIVIMVGGNLLRRGMHPRGLCRAARLPVLRAGPGLPGREG